MRAVRVATVKDDIVKGKLGLHQLPGAAEVSEKLVINGSSSLEKPSQSCAGEGVGGTLTAEAFKDDALATEGCVPMQ